MRRLICICLTLLSLSLLWSYPLKAAPEVIEGVKVDIKASSAMEAREKAFAEARMIAVKRKLAQEGRSDSDITPKQAENLTTFIDIIEEKSSGKQYTATFNVGVDLDSLSPGTQAGAFPRPYSPSFNPYYNQATLPQKTKKSWILVVPIDRNSTGTYAWDKTIPWIKQWQTPVRRGLTDYVVTEGDTDDKQILSNPAAAVNDAEVFQRLYDKYRPDGVGIVTLDTVFSSNSEREGVVEIALWTPARGLMVSRHPVYGELLPAEARSAAINALDQLTKDGNVFIDAQSPSLYYPTYLNSAMPQQIIEVPITAMLSTPQRWMEIRYALSSIPGLIVKPIRVSETRAELVVRYPGTRESLLNELRSRDLAK